MILLIAVVSTVLVLVRPKERHTGLEMWTRSRNHFLLYEPAAAAWNRDHPDQPPVHVSVISDQVLERRMLTGFLADTQTADLIEIERTTTGRVFAGPLSDIGFVDLTDRLNAEGLYDRINTPSFGPWMSRGRIFGLPHDVHPVLLAYRADIVEAAGIDVSQIETWDDFERLMRPVIVDIDGDGRPDRFALSMWYTNMDVTEVLILQAGGQYFDERGRATIDSDVNARVLARMTTWVCGPNRLAADAPEFTAAGNRMRLEGQVVCSFAPDWLGGVWRQDIPGLSGTVKVMPLPAWEPGGRRTSVWGGSMLGISRTTKRFDEAWAFAKYLYLSPDVARGLYEATGIISPVKELWSSDFYDEPSEYFCGQAVGRLYAQAAPNVPKRTSSPYNMIAKNRVRDAAIDLRRYADENGVYEADKLVDEARRLLARAQASVQREMQRNVFLESDTQ